MVHPHPVIPIHPATVGVAARGCEACMPTAAGPVCRSAVGPLCDAPAIHGPADEVQRVLSALTRTLGVERGLVESGLLHSLRLEPGEVELTLAVAPSRGGAELSDTAFQTLRALLPDTDIYVTHAGP